MTQAFVILQGQQSCCEKRHLKQQQLTETNPNTELTCKFKIVFLGIITCQSVVVSGRSRLG